jgi:hypothetical protein
MVIVICLFALARSSLPPGDQTERVRAFTRAIEFDFVSWTLDALSIKGKLLSLGTGDYLSEEEQSQLVLDYLALVQEIQQTEGELNRIFADPAVNDPQSASVAIRDNLTMLSEQRERLGPVAEAALESQIQSILVDLNLTLGGQPMPPILYHTTSPPLALIVSPRNVIRQEENISIDPTLTTDEREALEAQVDQTLDVSSLVVPIGGIGLYPTMVLQSSNINYLADVVSHEWTHNFLTLRPLGVNYLTSPELRTINETVASIAGQEIGRALVARYYPEYLPPPPEPIQVTPPPVEPTEPPAFDFRAEMAETRITADELLAEGKIEEAEAYMETRRQFIWENGYRLRKINQAYFAFFGAYASFPGGAAGEDPVGAAVRLFRVQSPNLATFVNRISWITTFDQLNDLVGQKS